MKLKCTRPETFKTTSKENALVPNNGVIYWHIDEKHITPDMDKFKVILAFEKAFSAWQPYFLPIRFESTSKKKEAPIVIRFMKNGDKGLPSPFSKNTLAYAYFPQKKSLGIHSDMYFNDDFKWAEAHKSGNINLWKVVVHELGHAFGIEHTSDIQDIMFPTYQPNDNINISEDTQAAVSFLYGTSPQKKSFDIKEFLNKLFPQMRHLNKLTELQLVHIGGSLGLDITVPYPKSRNVAVIHNFLRE